MIDVNCGTCFFGQPVKGGLVRRALDATTSCKLCRLSVYPLCSSLGHSS